jgi:hypothetical protein
LLKSLLARHIEAARQQAADLVQATSGELKQGGR